MNEGLAEQTPCTEAFEKTAKGRRKPSSNFIDVHFLGSARKFSM